MPIEMLEIAGLHILHWLISALLPVLLLGMAFYYWIVTHRVQNRSIAAVSQLSLQIDRLTGRTIDNLPAAASLFRQFAPESFSQAFERMQADCDDLYQERWLPDPRHYLNADTLLTPSGRNSLSWRPAASLLAAGLLGGMVSVLVQQIIPPPHAEMALALIMLPLITGTALSILMAAQSRYIRSLLDHQLQALDVSIGRSLPVFNDQSGVASLVDSFLEYDRQMKDSLENFSTTAAKLGDSDMVDGIRRSIEQVLTESVAPPIQQSAAMLGRLATELTNRQENGMQDLAARFATALSSELAAHMQPVNKEIAQMGSLMTDVRNYIEYAMRALETVRQQSQVLLDDTRTSIQQSGEVRASMAADFTRMDDQIRQITESTSQMAALYQGNEQNLAGSLQTFGVQLDQNSRKLGDLVHEAIQSSTEARLSAEGQQIHAGQYLAAMQNQIDQLTGQLGKDLNRLIEQIRLETGSIALHTADIGARLGQLDGTLRKTLDDFTRSSGQYVQETLGQFDTGLAEIVERLGETALEIQNAVDDLPSALRQGPHFGP